MDLQLNLSLLPLSTIMISLALGQASTAAGPIPLKLNILRFNPKKT